VALLRRPILLQKLRHRQTLLKLNSVHCHDASPWVDASIISPSVAHHMSLYVKNCSRLRHVTNQENH
jgi:hypothetical protein